MSKLLCELIHFTLIHGSTYANRQVGLLKRSSVFFWRLLKNFPTRCDEKPQIDFRCLSCLWVLVMYARLHLLEVQKNWACIRLCECMCSGHTNKVTCWEVCASKLMIRHIWKGYVHRISLWKGKSWAFMYLFYWVICKNSPHINKLFFLKMGPEKYVSKAEKSFPLMM